MNKIIKIIGFMIISLLLFGCAGGSGPRITSNPKDGLVDTPEEKQRIAKLINTQSNVKNTFDNVLKIQGKDKYESSAEYTKRMSGLSTYAVMEPQNLKSHYDPDRKLYLLYLGSKYHFSRDGNRVSAWSYVKGVRGDYFMSVPKDPSFVQERKVRTSSYIGSNAYGATARVTSYEYEKYVAHLDNITKLLGSKNVHKEEEDYYIGIPVSKEKAKYLDTQKLKTKIRVQFKNMGSSLYYSVFLSEATIDLPVSSKNITNGFDAHLKEFVWYNTSNKDILFQFAD